MKLTPEAKTAFCAALAETCNVGRACKAIGIARQTAYEWRDEDPEFAERWDRAKYVGVSVLEDEAVRRAHDGVSEPVFYMGEQVGTVQRYSDSLLSSLLKAHHPAFKDHSRLDLGNADGKPFEVKDDTDRAARLASLMAMAEHRKAAEQGDGEEEDLA